MRLYVDDAKKQAENINKGFGSREKYRHVLEVYMEERKKLETQMDK